MAQAYPDVISLGAGKPDFKTPNHIIEAGINALKSGWTHYTSNMGLLKLREAICSKLSQENNVDYSTDEVLITIGSSEALYLAIQTIIEEGDEVLLFDPFYIAYEPCIKLC